MTDRISLVEPYLIPADSNPHPWWSHNPYVLVRVETNEGIVGWGECHVSRFREDAMVATVRSVGDWLIGRPAADIRGALIDTFGAFGQQRPGLEVYGAFAGIEIALWDVLGKTAERACLSTSWRGLSRRGSSLRQHLFTQSSNS